MTDHLTSCMLTLLRCVAADMGRKKRYKNARWYIMLAIKELLR